MKRIIDYVMQKLRDTDKTSQKVIQLLEILATLCECKGVPVEQNQGKSCIHARIQSHVRHCVRCIIIMIVCMRLSMS